MGKMFIAFSLLLFIVEPYVAYGDLDNGQGALATSTTPDSPQWYLTGSSRLGSSGTMVGSPFQFILSSVSSALFSMASSNAGVPPMDLIATQIYALQINQIVSLLNSYYKNPPSSYVSSQLHSQLFNSVRHLKGIDGSRPPRVSVIRFMLELVVPLQSAPLPTIYHGPQPAVEPAGQHIFSGSEKPGRLRALPDSPQLPLRPTYQPIGIRKANSATRSTGSSSPIVSQPAPPRPMALPARADYGPRHPKIPVARELVSVTHRLIVPSRATPAIPTIVQNRQPRLIVRHIRRQQNRPAAPAKINLPVALHNQLLRPSHLLGYRKDPNQGRTYVGKGIAWQHPSFTVAAPLVRPASHALFNRGGNRFSSQPNLRHLNRPDSPSEPKARLVSNKKHLPLPQYVEHRAISGDATVYQKTVNTKGQQKTKPANQKPANVESGLLLSQIPSIRWPTGVMHRLATPGYSQQTVSKQQQFPPIQLIQSPNNYRNSAHGETTSQRLQPALTPTSNRLEPVNGAIKLIHIASNQTPMISRTSASIVVPTPIRMKNNSTVQKPTIRMAIPKQHLMTSHTNFTGITPLIVTSHNRRNAVWLQQGPPLKSIALSVGTVYRPRNRITSVGRIPRPALRRLVPVGTVKPATPVVYPNMQSRLLVRHTMRQQNQIPLPVSRLQHPSKSVHSLSGSQKGPKREKTYSDEMKNNMRRLVNAANPRIRPASYTLIDSDEVVTFQLQSLHHAEGDEEVLDYFDSLDEVIWMKFNRGDPNSSQPNRRRLNRPNSTSSPNLRVISNKEHQPLVHLIRRHGNVGNIAAYRRPERAVDKQDKRPINQIPGNLNSGRLLSHGRPTVVGHHTAPTEYTLHPTNARNAQHPTTTPKRLNLYPRLPVRRQKNRLNALTKIKLHTKRLLLPSQSVGSLLRSQKVPNQGKPYAAKGITHPHPPFTVDEPLVRPPIRTLIFTFDRSSSRISNQPNRRHLNHPNTVSESKARLVSNRKQLPLPGYLKPQARLGDTTAYQRTANAMRDQKMSPTNQNPGNVKSSRLLSKPRSVRRPTGAMHHPAPPGFILRSVSKKQQLPSPLSIQSTTNDGSAPHLEATPKRGRPIFMPTSNWSLSVKTIVHPIRIGSNLHPTINKAAVSAASVIASTLIRTKQKPTVGLRLGMLNHNLTTSKTRSTEKTTSTVTTHQRRNAVWFQQGHQSKPTALPSGTHYGPSHLKIAIGQKQLPAMSDASRNIQPRIVYHDQLEPNRLNAPAKLPVAIHGKRFLQPSQSIGNLFGAQKDPNQGTPYSSDRNNILQPQGVATTPLVRLGLFTLVNRSSTSRIRSITGPTEPKVRVVTDRKHLTILQFVPPGITLGINQEPGNVKYLGMVPSDSKSSQKLTASTQQKLQPTRIPMVLYHRETTHERVQSRRGQHPGIVNNWKFITTNSYVNRDAKSSSALPPRPGMRQNNDFTRKPRVHPFSSTQSTTRNIKYIGPTGPAPVISSLLKTPSIRIPASIDITVRPRTHGSSRTLNSYRYTQYPISQKQQLPPTLSIQSNTNDRSAPHLETTSKRFQPIFTPTSNRSPPVKAFVHTIHKDSKQNAAINKMDASVVVSVLHPAPVIQKATARAVTFKQYLTTSNRNSKGGATLIDQAPTVHSSVSTSSYTPNPPDTPPRSASSPTKTYTGKPPVYAAAPTQSMTETVQYIRQNRTDAATISLRRDPATRLPSGMRTIVRTTSHRSNHGRSSNRDFLSIVVQKQFVPILSIHALIHGRSATHRKTTSNEVQPISTSTGNRSIPVNTAVRPLHTASNRQTTINRANASVVAQKPTVRMVIPTQHLMTSKPQSKEKRLLHVSRHQRRNAIWLQQGHRSKPRALSARTDYGPSYPLEVAINSVILKQHQTAETYVPRVPPTRSTVPHSPEVAINTVILKQHQTAQTHVPRVPPTRSTVPHSPEVAINPVILKQHQTAQTYIPRVPPTRSTVPHSPEVAINPVILKQHQTAQTYIPRVPPTRSTVLHSPEVAINPVILKQHQTAQTYVPRVPPTRSTVPHSPEVAINPVILKQHQTAQTYISRVPPTRSTVPHSLEVAINPVILKQHQTAQTYVPRVPPTRSTVPHSPEVAINPVILKQHQTAQTHVPRVPPTRSTVPHSPEVAINPVILKQHQTAQTYIPRVPPTRSTVPHSPEVAINPVILKQHQTAQTYIPRVPPTRSTVPHSLEVAINPVILKQHQTAQTYVPRVPPTRSTVPHSPEVAINPVILKQHQTAQTYIPRVPPTRSTVPHSPEVAINPVVLKQHQTAQIYVPRVPPTRSTVPHSPEVAINPVVLKQHQTAQIYVPRVPPTRSTVPHSPEVAINPVILTILTDARRKTTSNGGQPISTPTGSRSIPVNTAVRPLHTASNRQTRINRAGCLVVAQEPTVRMVIPTQHLMTSKPQSKKKRLLNVSRHQRRNAIWLHQGHRSKPKALPVKTRYRTSHLKIAVGQIPRPTLDRLIVPSKVTPVSPVVSQNIHPRLQVWRQQHRTNALTKVKLPASIHAKRLLQPSNSTRNLFGPRKDPNHRNPYSSGSTNGIQPKALAAKAVRLPLLTLFNRGGSRMSSQPKRIHLHRPTSTGIPTARAVSNEKYQPFLQFSVAKLTKLAKESVYRKTKGSEGEQTTRSTNQFNQPTNQVRLVRRPTGVVHHPAPPGYFLRPVSMKQPLLSIHLNTNGRTAPHRETSLNGVQPISTPPGNRSVPVNTAIRPIHTASNQQSIINKASGLAVVPAQTRLKHDTTVQKPTVRMVIPSQHLTTSNPQFNGKTPLNVISYQRRNQVRLRIPSTGVHSGIHPVNSFDGTTSARPIHLKLNRNSRHLLKPMVIKTKQDSFPKRFRTQSRPSLNEATAPKYLQQATYSTTHHTEYPVTDNKPQTPTSPTKIIQRPVGIHRNASTGDVNVRPVVPQGRYRLPLKRQQYAQRRVPFKLQYTEVRRTLTKPVVPYPDTSYKNRSKNSSSDELYSKLPDYVHFRDTPTDTVEPQFASLKQQPTEQTYVPPVSTTRSTVPHTPDVPINPVTLKQHQAAQTHVPRVPPKRRTVPHTHEVAIKPVNLKQRQMAQTYVPPVPPKRSTVPHSTEVAINPVTLKQHQMAQTYVPGVPPKRSTVPHSPEVAINPVTLKQHQMAQTYVPGVPPKRSTVPHSTEVAINPVTLKQHQMAQTYVPGVPPKRSTVPHSPEVAINLVTLKQHQMAQTYVPGVPPKRSTVPHSPEVAINPVIVKQNETAQPFLPRDSPTGSTLLNSPAVAPRPIAMVSADRSTNANTFVAQNSFRKTVANDAILSARLPGRLIRYRDSISSSNDSRNPKQHRVPHMVPLSKTPLNQLASPQLFVYRDQHRTPNISGYKFIPHTQRPADMNTFKQPFHYSQLILTRKPSPPAPMPIPMVTTEAPSVIAKSPQWYSNTDRYPYSHSSKLEVTDAQTRFLQREIRVRIPAATLNIPQIHATSNQTPLLTEQESPVPSKLCLKGVNAKRVYAILKLLSVLGSDILEPS